MKAGLLVWKYSNSSTCFEIWESRVTYQIARFMGPTWGPPGSCRPQMCPILAPWTLLSGIFLTREGRVIKSSKTFVNPSCYQSPVFVIVDTLFHDAVRPLLKGTADRCAHWWANICRTYTIDGLVQEGRNSSALAMELRLSCTGPWLSARKT